MLTKNADNWILHDRKTGKEECTNRRIGNLAKFEFGYCFLVPKKNRVIKYQEKRTLETMKKPLNRPILFWLLIFGAGVSKTQVN